MLIDPKYMVDKATAGPGDPSAERHGICDVFMDPVDGVAVATNDVMLAIVPVTVEDGDTTGRIRASAFALARKAVNFKWGRSQGERVPKSDGPARVAETGGGGDYPPWSRIVPKYRRGTGTYSVGIDLQQLATLAEALGGPARVVLTFGEDAVRDAIVVEPVDETDRALGVLMPVRY